MILLIPMSAYPYISSFNKMINDKEELTKMVVESEVNKEIKEIIDEEIENYLNELEKEVTKAVKESLKKSTNGKINVDALMKTKEVKDSIKKIKNEVADILGKFNTEDNINVILVKMIDVLHDNEEIDIEKLVKETFDTIIKKDNIKLEAETKELLNEFATEFAKEIYKEIQASENPYITLNEENNAIVNPLPGYIQIINKYTKNILMSIIVLVFIILLINIKSLHSGVRGIGIVVLISGIIVGLTSLAFKILDIGSLLGESNSTNLVIKLVQTIISKVSMIGIIYLIIGIICLVISVILSKIKKPTIEAK